jgi:hypothetical protein
MWLDSSLDKAAAIGSLATVRAEFCVLFEPDMAETH